MTRAANQAMTTTTSATRPSTREHDQLGDGQDEPEEGGDPALGARRRKGQFDGLGLRGALQLDGLSHRPSPPAVPGV